MELFNYQKEGVAFLKQKDGRALIADDMGLGKTCQALSWLKDARKAPCVIVVPAAVKLNWEKEVYMWIDKKARVCILNGLKTTYELRMKAKRSTIIILNYDILQGWRVWLKENINIQSIILDEAHYIKSKTAKRTKETFALCKDVKHIICITGTPILSRPIEIFNICKLVKPELFPSWWTYASRYCNMKITRFGTDVRGASNTGELNNKLQSIMIRRLKKDVLKDLPDKIYSNIPIEIDNWREYKAAEEGMKDWIKGRDASNYAESLAKLEYMKQAACKGKLKTVIKWIHDFMDGDEKLIVMGTHIEFLSAIERAFSKINVKLTGQTPKNKRQWVVDQFQNNPHIKLFIGNIKAAGVGITLTASSNVAFVELPWTPGEYQQAADRSHRIGQKDTVNIWNLIAKNTIEEDIEQMLTEKQEVINEVIDGIKQEEQESIINKIIRGFKNA